MRARLITIMAVAAAMLAVSAPAAQATMPHATMPHAQASATMPHAGSMLAPNKWTASPSLTAVDPFNWKCGALIYRYWGRAQVCVAGAGANMIYKVAVRDEITDGKCVEVQRVNATGTRWQVMFNWGQGYTRSCTTGGWKTVIDPDPPPDFGARMWRDANHWVRVPVPLG